MSDLPKSKYARVCYLLDHWEDIWGPPVSGGRGGGGGGSPHLSPMSRHPSVKELDRCLHVLRAESKLEHDHLKAFHGAEWRVRYVPRSPRRRKGGKLERFDPIPQRHRAKPAWVAMGYVRSAEWRLVELFRGPVFIPGELWEALTLSSAEIEVRELRRRSARGAAA